jgi:hypothetical protein
MSVELHVFFPYSKMPTVQQWQNAVYSNEFDLKLPTLSSIQEHSGFLLIDYQENSTGFEFDVSDPFDTVNAYDIAQIVPYSNYVVANFRWGGDLLACATAFATASLLAIITEGIVFDPQEGDIFDTKEALEEARQMFKQIR